MAVLIDPPLWPAHGRLWSHLVSDHSLEELHAFARAAGVPERGFEGDHYDVPEERYEQLVAAGAEPVGPRELLSRLQRSGLRRPKRRGERVVASAVQPGGRRRVDTVRSTLTPPGPVTGLTIVVSSGAGLLFDTGAGGLPRICPVTDDLCAATGFAARLSGVPAGEGIGWWRVGYLRSAPLAATEPAARYESVLAARYEPAPAARRTALRAAPASPEGHRWCPADEVFPVLRPELVPLVEFALAPLSADRARPGQGSP